MGKHRSEEEVYAAVKLYADGKTVAEVSRTVGANEGTVRGWIRAAGLQIRPRTTTNLHRTQKAQRIDREPILHDLYTSGDSLNAVARRHNVPSSTLHRWRAAAENDSAAVDRDELAYKGEWIRVGAILRGSARDVA